MEQYNLASILQRTQPVHTKTAEEAKKEKDKSDPVEEARKDVSNAIADATKEGEKDSKDEKDAEKTSAVKQAQAVEKIANELLDADTDTMMKLAFSMGSAFEEGRLAQASAHVNAAHALQEESSMPKTAEEAQSLGYMDGIQTLGAVVDAADAGYAETFSGIEKMAASVYDRGYRHAAYLVKKAQEKHSAQAAR